MKKKLLIFAVSAVVAVLALSYLCTYCPAETAMAAIAFFVIKLFNLVFPEKETEKNASQEKA